MAKARKLAELPDYLARALLGIDIAFGSVDEAQDVRRAMDRLRERRAE